MHGVGLGHILIIFVFLRFVFLVLIIVGSYLDVKKQERLDREQGKVRRPVGKLLDPLTNTALRLNQTKPMIIKEVATGKIITILVNSWNEEKGVSRFRGWSWALLSDNKYLFDFGEGFEFFDIDEIKEYWEEDYSPLFRSGEWVKFDEYDDVFTGEESPLKNISELEEEIKTIIRGLEEQNKEDKDSGGEE